MPSAGSRSSGALEPSENQSRTRSWPSAKDGGLAPIDSLPRLEESASLPPLEDSALLTDLTTQPVRDSSLAGAAALPCGRQPQLRSAAAAARGPPGRAGGPSPAATRRRPAELPPEPLTTLQRFRLLCAGEAEPGSSSGGRRCAEELRPAARAPLGERALLAGTGGPVVGRRLREALREALRRRGHGRGLELQLLEGSPMAACLPLDGWLLKAVPRKGSGVADQMLNAVQGKEQADSRFSGAGVQPPPLPKPKEKVRRESFLADSGDTLVMNRYSMLMGDGAFLGEGTSSICRRGLDTQTQRAVAIKTYKVKKPGEKVALVKFQRQVHVLEELKRPFETPEDPRLWSKELALTGPEQVFMQMLDYSKDAQGRPGTDPSDGQLYVITEIAQFSLQDYIKTRKQERRPMSKEMVRSLVRSVVLVAAGLHAKGFVHMDLKPENLMIFDGVLKLIDVDGCVRIGTSISIDDESLSFSPVYCSPEWASFLTEEEGDEMSLTASPALDVWSIGMTLMELVTLEPVLKPQYASFLRHGRDREEASFLFLEWLGSLQKAPLPQQIREHDAELQSLLHENLLVCDPLRRKSLAESLGHPFVSAQPGLSRCAMGPLVELKASQEVALHRRNRVEDKSKRCILKGILWKLNNNGDPKDVSRWRQRDMWIANTGALCYFSLKDNKRLQLMDAPELHEATVTRFEGSAIEHAFKVCTPHQSLYFASESEEMRAKWMEAWDQVKNDVTKTMRFGATMATDLRRYRLKVRNRRKALDENVISAEGYKPRFKGFLWKLKTNGDVDAEGDWVKREMWLSKNGSLVYLSAREERELVYYTATDIARATASAVSETTSACPPESWRFRVLLAPTGDVDLQPGEFAAESEARREAWLKEFERFHR